MSITEEELKRLVLECRLYAKGKRPEFSLRRVADSLESLIKSIDEEAIGPANPLSKRESEVLELIALGYTNKEMAGAFKLSEKTIEYHLSQIFKKTDASKRTEAVTNAIRNNWLSST